MEHKSIEEPIGAPGGWALPEHIETVRAALRRERSYLKSIRGAADKRAGIIAATPGHSVEHLADTRALVVRWGEKLAVCEATIKLFDGIAHGAQIVALPSPEEEAVHHIHVTARGRAALESLTSAPDGRARECAFLPGAHVRRSGVASGMEGSVRRADLTADGWKYTVAWGDSSVETGVAERELALGTIEVGVIADA